MTRCVYGDFYYGVIDGDGGVGNNDNDEYFSIMAILGIRMRVEI